MSKPLKFCLYDGYHLRTARDKSGNESRGENGRPTVLTYATREAAVNKNRRLNRDGIRYYNVTEATPELLKPYIERNYNF